MAATSAPGLPRTPKSTADLVNPVQSAAATFASLLADAGVAYALIGGLAVGARTDPRFTQDVDFAVAVGDDSEAEAVVHAFIRRGYLPRTLIENEKADRLATARMESPNDGTITDLLFASSGIESEIAAAAEPINVFPTVRMPIARIGHLIALKLLARNDAERPQDLVDLRALLAVADKAEMDLLEEAIDLIHRRGFNRGRDLRDELAKLTR